MRKPELLVPASSLEVLKTAVIFGADAVYIGGEAFGLRAKAKNFSMEDMKEGIAFAHEHGVKVYVTANILAHNRDLEGVEEYFRELKEVKPDALIIADPGVFEIVSVRKSNAISVPRRITQTMLPIISGIHWERSEWFLQGSFPCRKSKRSVQTFRRIWRLRPLCMELCAFLIPEDVCSAVILQAEMPTREPVRIRVAGNMQLWKRNDRVSIFRFMKMKEAPIFLIPRIFA